MAIGHECCLGVRNEEQAWRRAQLDDIRKLGQTSRVGLQFIDLKKRDNNKQVDKEKLITENEALRNHPVIVLGNSENLVSDADNKKQRKEGSVGSESMCASGILCPGVSPCIMSDFIHPIQGRVAIDDDGQEIGMLLVANDSDESSAENINMSDTSSEATDMVNTDLDRLCKNVEPMDVDDNECKADCSNDVLDESEGGMLSPDEGSKGSQSSDNGYASDSSVSDASDTELNQVKNPSEEESSSSEDESSPDDSPSPPSADESPLPSVEEVETRTGISFERTLSTSSQNDTSFSFSTSSANGHLSSSSSSGYTSYTNASRTTCEKTQHRSQVMGLLEGRLRLIDDSERCLLRYVLLKTNLSFLRKEARDERLSQHRRRRHHVLSHGYPETMSSGGLSQGLCDSPAVAAMAGSSFVAANSISPLARPTSSTSRSVSGTFTTTCTSGSGNSVPSRTPPVDGNDNNDDEPPLKRPRYAPDENKENYSTSSCSVFVSGVEYSSSETSGGYYSSGNGHYTSVCNSNGYYSTTSQSMYCMNHLSNHYSASSSNYFTNSCQFGGSSTQYISSYSCSSGSQTNNDRSSGSSSNDSSCSNVSSFSSSCGQVDAFSSAGCSNDASSSCSQASSDTNVGSSCSMSNGGLFNASNVTPSSCSSVGLRSNLDTIIEAIDQEIMRSNYSTSGSRSMSTTPTSGHSSYGSFSSYSNSGGLFDNSVGNHGSSHIFGNSEGTSYHIFGNSRHGSSSNMFVGNSSSSYGMNQGTSYSSSYSSYSSPFSDASSALPPQNPCGRSSQFSGNDFQSLVYNSLMASLES